jgi:hypothetical protein
MLMVIICSSLVGAVLGTRFKVQVLFLVAPAAFVVTAAIMGISQSAFGSALLAGIAAVVALQIGYFGGLLTRFSIAAARVPPKEPLRSSTTAQS